MSGRNSFLPLMFVFFIALLVLPAPVDAQTIPGEDLRTAQMRTCRDSVWQRPEFSTVPKAALFVMYGGFTPQRAWVYWIVDWSGLRAAGKCRLPTDQAEVQEVEIFFNQLPGGRTPP